MNEHKTKGSNTINHKAAMSGRRFYGRIMLNKALAPSTLQDKYTKAADGGKKSASSHTNVKLLMLSFIFTCFFILFHFCVVSHGGTIVLHQGSVLSKSIKSEGEGNKLPPPAKIYSRLLKRALDALLKNHQTGQKSSKIWKEPHVEATLWKPCANSSSVHITETSKTNSRYMLVSANGGLNQQRVAICNAVAVAALLNATLVLPKFLNSNVWKDPSQFGDIYEEEYFIRTMKREINIVKKLPLHLKPSSIDIITDSDLSKEAKPDEYINKILPILEKNGAVHFLGFGNRLGFDPIPFNLQRLRCKCNFHALKFVPKIQEVASLLIKRMRMFDFSRGSLDNELLGNFMSNNQPLTGSSPSLVPRRYLALHLRFEIDMVAYSMCDFGGGENERRELKAYREHHFPLLVQRLKHSAPVSPEKLRSLGRCPLTPEEAALFLAALGYEHGTYIYVAGSSIYGGISRMQSLHNLYPNVVTKEDLLTPSELAPFRNFSSQLAALEFIACAAADVFAMTDSGSQLSSLVSGFRMYHGGGFAPTLRPNKKWLAQILLRNTTIRWTSFKNAVQKMNAEGQKIKLRQFGQSIYRKPRSPECMCKYAPTQNL
ncbi:unnamed protein product [Rhodiola kirilowii]